MNKKLLAMSLISIILISNVYSIIIIASSLNELNNEINNKVKEQVNNQIKELIDSLNKTPDDLSNKDVENFKNEGDFESEPSEFIISIEGKTASGVKTRYTIKENASVELPPHIDEGIKIRNIYNKTIAIIDKSGNENHKIIPLLVDNNIPLSNRRLELYFKENDEWILIDSQITSVSGRCEFNFKFSEEIIQKTLDGKVIIPYKVVYKEGDVIVKSESACLILSNYDGPKVERVEFDSKTDYYLKATGHIKCYKEWFHLWTDELEYISISVYSRGVWLHTYGRDVSDEHWISCTIWTSRYNYIQAGEPVDVLVYARDKAGFEDSLIASETIIDDDPSPPSITWYDIKDTSKIHFGDGDVYDYHAGDYFISIPGYDYSFWAMEVRYKYGESGTVRYLPVQYLSSGSRVPEFFISRDQWTQYLGYTLFYSYRAWDYDSDHPGDSCDLDWSEWEDGGVLLDDNTQVPDLDHIAISGDIDDSRLEPYFFDIAAQDSSGWKVDIEYKFGIGGAIISDYLSTTSSSLTTLS